MTLVVLIAGIGFLLAGLLAIGFGIPVKEFSFGNTLIVAGAIVACTGMLMIGLWAVVRELKQIAQRLGPGMPAEHTAGLSATLGDQAPEDGGLLFSPDQPAGNAEPAASSRDRGRYGAPAAPEPVEAAAAARPRRNLLFSSTSRKERERAQARTAEPSAADTGLASAGSEEPPPASFDDAWPKPDRARTADASPARRGGRAPSTLAEPSPGPAAPDRMAPPARSAEPPPVTVLKSGVVDGMAYSLYSDGSIEAQMPEGMMRFASIDELRSHLDQRP